MTTPLGEHEHRPPEAGFPVDRMGYLTGLCQGRRVLHIGCADDTAMADKLAAGRHLHGRLAAVSDAAGVDLAIYRLTALARHGVDRLVVAAALSPPFRAGDFEDLLLGEILEHLPDLGGVLRRLRASQVAERLIVTVPNAYSAYPARRLGEGIEVVNPDHVYTFTPYTMQNLVARSGCEVIEMRTYAWTRPTAPSLSVLSAVRRVLGDRDARPAHPRTFLANDRDWLTYRRQPFRGDGLIAVAA